MKNRVGVIVAVAGALVILYLLFKPPSSALASSTAAVGNTANPNVTPVSASAVANNGLSSLFSAIAGGLGLTTKTVTGVLSANGAPQPLDPTSSGISDALAEVQAAENDPISQSIAAALTEVQDPNYAPGYSDPSLLSSGSPALDSTLSGDFSVNS